MIFLRVFCPLFFSPLSLISIKRQVKVWSERRHSTDEGTPRLKDGYFNTVVLNLT